VLNQVIQNMSPAERQRVLELSAVGRKVILHRPLPFKIVHGDPPGPSKHVIAPVPDQAKQKALDAINAAVRQASKRPQ
jgi:hypothetical protein